MSRLYTLLEPHWFGLSLLAVAVCLGAVLLVIWWRHRRWSVPIMVLGSLFLLAGSGGIVVPSGIGMVLAIAAGGLIFLKLIWLILTGQWSAPVAAGAAAGLVLGLGGWFGIPGGEALFDLAQTLKHVEAVQPAWLWLLLLIPLIIGLSYRSLAGLGTFRRWLAIGLRCSLVLFLTLALAEVRFKQTTNRLTVLFLVDLSLSMPEETDETAPKNPATGRHPDRAWERIAAFVKDAVKERGPDRKRDMAGLIVFGRRPRLELPPSDAPRLNFEDFFPDIDKNYTDIGAAFKLALASFPEGTAKRIVLLSDGNENLGNALEVARLAKQNGVEIDIVPIGKGRKNESEVLVQSVEVPPLIAQGSRFPIRVLVRSYNTRPVKGILELFQIAGGKEEHVPPSPWGDVVLRPGLNMISFPPPVNRPSGSFTYKARFIPQKVVMEDGTEKPAPVGRLQNKEASTHVLAMGQRRVLFVEATREDNAQQLEHQFLVDHLRGLGPARWRIDHVRSNQLPRNKADLGVFLSNYDCVVLANVPSEQLDEDQQEMVRSNVEDQGCGLIMIGGPEGFGAGGWQGTPVEKALPVDCDIKAIKVQGKGGLVLVMHACEMPDGNRAQKDIAKLAINKLGPLDMLGVVGLGFAGQEWHVKFNTVGDRRRQMIAQVEKMTPGDMPDFDTPLQMAYDELSNPKYDLAKKHVIIISDGDPQLTNANLLNKFKAEKITISTVGVATHGPAEDRQMLNMAQSTGGKYHKVTNPKLLPEIYTKEVRLVSQSFLYEKQFPPNLIFSDGPTQGLPGKLPSLYGFVRTTAKPAVNVQLLILGPPQGDQDFPILATWQYGLGKAVAFTSDARSSPGRLTWDRDWAGAPLYKRFWEQALEWSLRAVESGKLTMTTEYKDGRVKVMIDAWDKQNKPITDLTLRGGVTTSSSKADETSKFRLGRFDQKKAGRYEAEFKADEAGSYFMTVQPVRTVKGQKKVVENGKEVVNEFEYEEGFDTVRGGVTIPYSQEFADMETNVGLLENLRALTGGVAHEEGKLPDVARGGDIYREAAPTAKSLQPIWFWLVLLTAVLLFFDVAVRRIAVEPAEWVAGGVKVWNHLRGVIVAPQTPQFLERLKSRKTEIGEALEKSKAATRFEPSPDAPVGPPPGADMPRPVWGSPATSQPPALAPGKEESPEDYASRLMRAKKRAMEDRDKK